MSIYDLTKTRLNAASIKDSGGNVVVWEYGASDVNESETDVFTWIVDTSLYAETRPVKTVYNAFVTAQMIFGRNDIAFAQAERLSASLSAWTAKDTDVEVVHCEQPDINIAPVPIEGGQAIAYMATVTARAIFQEV